MNLLRPRRRSASITAVFQWGWAASLSGSTRRGRSRRSCPVMMFAIVFGLSMDYQVFLVSRIYEEWHRTGDNQHAVTRGLAATGRTITAAAAIMVLVFGAFILGGERVIMLFGLGLAGAVLLDALVIRMALVPGPDAARRQGQLVAAGAGSTAPCRTSTSRATRTSRTRRPGISAGLGSETRRRRRAVPEGATLSIQGRPRVAVEEPGLVGEHDRLDAVAEVRASGGRA